MNFKKQQFAVARFIEDRHMYENHLNQNERSDELEGPVVFQILNERMYVVTDAFYVGRLEHSQ